MTENLLCGHCQVLKYINVIIYFTETKWWNYLIASRTTELQQAEVIIFCMTLSASHIVTHIEEFWLTLLLQCGFSLLSYGTLFTAFQLTWCLEFHCSIAAPWFFSLVAVLGIIALLYEPVSSRL